MKSLKYTSNITFFAEIASGQLDVNDIKAWILSAEERKAAVTEDTKEHVWSSGKSASNGDNILVLNAKDIKGMQYRMARCCNPVFGDDVFGFVTRTEGIKIHRMSCPNAARLLERFPYRIQKVRWQDTATTSDFQCTLVVTADSDSPVLANVLQVIGGFKASVRSVNVKDRDRNGLSEISVRILVPSNMELDKIISQLSNLKDIHRVKRI